MNILQSKQFWTAVIASIAVALAMKYLFKDKVDHATGEVKSSFIGFNGL